MKPRTTVGLCALLLAAVALGYFLGYQHASGSAGITPVPHVIGKFNPGSCCDKMQATGRACQHKCCISAASQGAICRKCNPQKAPVGTIATLRLRLSEWIRP